MPLLKTIEDLTENGYEIYLGIDQKYMDNLNKNWSM